MIRLLILCLVVLSGTATAAPKIALPPIEGDLTGDLRDDVVAAIDGDQLVVLGQKEVNRVYDRLNLDSLAELTEKQAKKLSKDLEADAVVTAVLAKKGKKKTLKFRVFVNGKKQKGFTVEFKSAKSKKFRTALRDKMVGRISGEDETPMVAQAEEEPAPKKKAAKVEKVDEDAEDPNPKPKRVAAKDEAAPEGDGEAEGGEDKPRKKKKKKAAAVDEDAELGESGVESRLEKRMAPKHTANRAAARADAGVSISNRSLIFTKRANFPEGPKPFKSKPVPGARFAGELYPFAFYDPDSILAGLGVAGSYDKTLVLNLGTSAEPGVKVPVDQTAFSVGGRVRFAFGKKPTSPTITVGLDYGRRRWKADRSKLMDRTSLGGMGSLDLPDTNYAYLAPGLGFRIPIGGLIALVAYGEPLFVNKAGPIQKAESYGKAKIFGFQGEGGVEVILMNRFAIRAMFEMTQIGFDFQGTGGMLANSRDNDPTTPDVGGATDRSLGGVFTLAVLY